MQLVGREKQIAVYICSPRLRRLYSFHIRASDSPHYWCLLAIFFVIPLYNRAALRRCCTMNFSNPVHYNQDPLGLLNEQSYCRRDDCSCCSLKFFFCLPVTSGSFRSLRWGAQVRSKEETADVCKEFFWQER